MKQRTLEWVALIGTLGTLSGIGLAIYHYNQSQVHPNLCFALDPNRTELLSSQKISLTPIKVFRQDGTEIKRDLTALRFFVWNSGKASIKPDNMLETISISLDDKDASILDYKIIKRSRDVTKLELRRNSAHPNNVLNLRRRKYINFTTISEIASVGLYSSIPHEMYEAAC